MMELCEPEAYRQSNEQACLSVIRVLPTGNLGGNQDIKA